MVSFKHPDCPCETRLKTTANEDFTAKICIQGGHRLRARSEGSQHSFAHQKTIFLSYPCLCVSPRAKSRLAVVQSFARPLLLLALKEHNLLWNAFVVILLLCVLLVAQGNKDGLDGGSANKMTTRSVHLSFWNDYKLFLRCHMTQRGHKERLSMNFSSTSITQSP